MSKIAYLGPEFSFHHLALKKVFNEDKHEFVPFATFDEVFENVCYEDFVYGIVAVENSLAGSVSQNYDLINSFDVQIISEVVTPISHCLLAKPGVKIEDLQKVFSHEKALEQCQNFFKNHPKITSKESKSTAEAAQFVASSTNKRYAAIGSKEAGQKFDLEVLIEDLQDQQINWTRFVVFKKEDRQYDPESNKAMIIFKLPHVVGSLARVLGVFAFYECNIIKIESRPIPDHPFEYSFFVEVGFETLPIFQKAIYRAGKHVSVIKVVGVYKV
jgi:prephenate dehydratase